MSKIKVCFIPPMGMTNYAARGDMIMCLAQLLHDLHDPSYAATMNRLKDTKFTLLDNGACEGKMLSNEALERIDKDFGADELVLPDVLGNSVETFAASTEYLKHHTRYRQGVSYMGVVQGSSADELQSLVDKYADVPEVTTLGLPRLLLDRMIPSVRINMAIWIAAEFPKRFQVHFLGASSSWLKEPYHVAKYALPVRSIDTSLPFNYGLAGVLLESFQGVTEAKINRPKGYFEQWHELTSRTTVIENMTIYKEWCSGKKTPSGKL